MQPGGKDIELETLLEKAKLARQRHKTAETTDGADNGDEDFGQAIRRYKALKEIHWKQDGDFIAELDKKIDIVRRAGRSKPPDS